MDRAERRGLVVRTRDPDDRRATWVELTDEGTRLAMQTYDEVSARLQRLIHHLPPEEQEHLTAVVEQILAKEALQAG